MFDIAMFDWMLFFLLILRIILRIYAHHPTRIYWMNITMDAMGGEI